MKKQKKVQRFEPEVTLDQLLAYDPERPETHTKFGIVNAVCEKMFRPGEVTLPIHVAASLGWPRIKLSHAMEVLTGYNLADLRAEMMAKRWRQYREAHPGCKPHELAAAIGFDCYNSYWRFLDRNRKHFPELEEEEQNLSGHVMSIMEPLMKDESIAVRRIYGLLPYRGGKAEAEACARLLYQHGCQVASLVEYILKRHHITKLRKDKLRDIALLRMIGIVWTDTPELHCHGTEPFSSYSQKGAHFLVKHRQTIAATSAAYPHPMPLISDTFEGIISYASCFYSIFNPLELLTLDEVRANLAKTDPDALAAFDHLHQLFG